MRRFIKKMRKSFRYGEKGFTLIELLIVVAILGILAAVVLPNIGTFLRSGNLAASNSEAAAIKTAAAAEYAETGTWEASSATLTTYMDRPIDATVYNFVTSGTNAGNISDATAGSGYTNGFTFNATTQQWE